MSCSISQSGLGCVQLHGVVQPVLPSFVYPVNWWLEQEGQSSSADVLGTIAYETLPSKVSCLCFVMLAMLTLMADKPLAGGDVFGMAPCTVQHETSLSPPSMAEIADT